MLTTPLLKSNTSNTESQEDHQKRLPEGARHWRRWLVPAGLAVFGVIGVTLFRVAPQSFDIRLDLGEDHMRYLEVQVSYVPKEKGPKASVREAIFYYPEGAPRQIVHKTTLAPLEYEVEAHAKDMWGIIHPLSGKLSNLSSSNERYRVYLREIGEGP